MNRKNFLISMITSIVIFIIGTIYLIIPAYYGIDNLTVINTNSLLISILLIYAVIHMLKYVILGKQLANESIYKCIIASITGLINIGLNKIICSNSALTISIIIFILLITILNTIKVKKYINDNNAYYYIELMCLILFFIIGCVLVISLNNNTYIQVLIIGFLFIIISILEAVNSSIKCMLKAKRFLNKVK